MISNHRKLSILMYPPFLRRICVEMPYHLRTYPSQVGICLPVVLAVLFCNG